MAWATCLGEASNFALVNDEVAMSTGMLRDFMATSTVFYLFLCAHVPPSNISCTQEKVELVKDTSFLKKKTIGGGPACLTQPPG